MQENLGRHVLLDLYDCSKEKLNDLVFLEKQLKKAVEIAEATLVNTLFHQFSPHGVTGIALIEESHLSIHTWPEHNYAAIDLFTCSDSMKTTEAVSFLVEQLESKRQETRDVKRGLISNTDLS